STVRLRLRSIWKGLVKVKEYLESAVVVDFVVPLK
ncbi:hypothetical protein A2U01_0111194, partial [Trifolium medium]|nr:hypothetical protein [Trifolium medium]